jgi:L-ribulose-5-phosphate 4-epimerase
MLENLKRQVLEANLELVRQGLVTLTWGNVSGIDRASSLVVIKPSGVSYEAMNAADMVVVDLEGNVVEGSLRPSSDTPTHIFLYKAFSKIGGITHTHSTSATMFAQARREIPCFGTTHADHFHGTIPVTRILSKKEVAADYEGNTGAVIVERFKKLDPIAMPGVLVGGHAPFTWGSDAMDAMKNSLILERVAQMAMGSLQLDPKLAALPVYIQEKHYQRKHGPDAYYGQKK